MRYEKQEDHTPSTDLVAASVPTDKIELTDVGMRIADNLTFDEWLATGRSLQRMGRLWRWWTGDWLVHGEHRWGEKYSQGVEVTGSEEKTLRNAVYVASRIEMSRRRDAANRCSSW